MEASLDALQRAVGGHIEVVKAGERVDLIMNEDGAHNLLGTFDGVSITGRRAPRPEGGAGEIVDVTEDDVAEVLARFTPARTMN